jgi:hypothetical protein
MPSTHSKVSDLRFIIVEGTSKLGLEFAVEKEIREKKITSLNLIQISYAQSFNPFSFVEKEKYSCAIVYKV